MKHLFNKFERSSFVITSWIIGEKNGVESYVFHVYQEKLLKDKGVKLKRRSRKTFNNVFMLKLAYAGHNMNWESWA